MCVCASTVCVPQCARGCQRTTCRGWFSPSTMWVLGLKSDRFSGSAASTLIHWDILPGLLGLLLFYFLSTRSVLNSVQSKVSLSHVSHFNSRAFVKKNSLKIHMENYMVKTWYTLFLELFFRSAVWECSRRNKSIQAAFSQNQDKLQKKSPWTFLAGKTKKVQVILTVV